MKTVEVIIRQQSPRRGTSGWSGPNCYVVAVIREANGEPVGGHPLSEHNIKKYGWEVIGCGEGYLQHRGPRSAYGKAILKAKAIQVLYGMELKLGAEAKREVAA